MERPTFALSTLLPRKSVTDSYKFAPNAPVLYRNLEDDVSTILTACVQLGYYYYLYGGMVIQIELANYSANYSANAAHNRYFISFVLQNDGKQRFHEASSCEKVFNAERDEDAFEWFLAELLEHSKPKPPKVYTPHVY